MAKPEEPKTELPEHGSSDDAGLARLAKSTNGAGQPGIGTRLRNYMLTGLIVVGPVGITLYTVWWFINLVDGWVKPFVPAIYNPETYLPISVPGIGLVFAILILMFVGALTANLFGRTLVSYGEILLGRMPVVRNVYRALKQIFETVLSQSSASFQKVGIIEYPRRGIYAMVFVSKETGGEIRARKKFGQSLLSVFLPTTPNPTSGFLLFVPEDEIIILDMTVEDAAKLVISAGLVEPVYQSHLKDLAQSAGAQSGDGTGDAGPLTREDPRENPQEEPGQEAAAGVNKTDPKRKTEPAE